MHKPRRVLLLILLSVSLLISGCAADAQEENKDIQSIKKIETKKSNDNVGKSTAEKKNESIRLEDIPQYKGSPFIVINDNVPRFEKLSKESYESYAKLDSLGRCGTCIASVGIDLMPTEKRASIGSVKPSGWNTVKYQGIIEGNYLYNRCHLIGYQLTAENANDKNLITGTRYMNTEGMLPFENMVADYIKETKNHVMYRVTPVFEGDNLVASGVHMEAESVEDEGEGILFNIYCYNVQPGIKINYKNGSSKVEEKSAWKKSNAKEKGYVLNTNTKKFHTPSCASLNQIKKENRENYTGSREVLIEQGYIPCKNCNP